MHGVERDIPNDMCVSCGICKGVCSKRAIKYIRNKQGQYLPQIDDDKCVDCELCVKSCPAIKTSLTKLYERVFGSKPNSIYEGTSLTCFSAHVKDERQLHRSTSGGIATCIVGVLLKAGKYDSAYLVDTYRYDQQVLSKRKTAGGLDNTEKSRYVPVSHELLVRNMLENKNERIIIIATPCAIEGLQKVIDIFHLNRENYLFLGLFCNSVLNYNVWNYFGRFNKRDTLERLYFRSKDNNDWFYGAVMPVFEKGGSKRLHPGRKMLVKNYYTLKRCIFCIDKMNILADISVGDDNTNKGDGSSSTVIVRTQKGKEAFDLIGNEIISEETSMEMISKSQQVKELHHHYGYNAWYNQNGGLAPIDEHVDDVIATAEDIKKLKKLLRKQKMGREEMTGFLYHLTCAKWIVLENARRIKKLIKRG